MSMKENIKIQNLNLKYRFVKKMNLKKEIAKFYSKKKSIKRKEVWALKNINFTVEKGKTIGIIGPNGAGKTTLLKVIAKVFEPDSGTVELYSDSVSLLTLGAGFHPELLGIDNIYLNGLLLGFSKKEIDQKMEKIIDFSELGEYIFYPVKTYSSGMRVRLAFSISSFIEPDILLIDEVLGVGDERFKKKSKERIRELVKTRTVFLASHSMSSIVDLCDLTLWLHKGEMMEFGDSREVVKKYRDYNSKQKINDKRIRI